MMVQTIIVEVQGFRNGSQISMTNVINRLDVNSKNLTAKVSDELNNMIDFMIQAVNHNTYGNKCLTGKVYINYTYQEPYKEIYDSFRVDYHHSGNASVTTSSGPIKDFVEWVMDIAKSKMA